MRRIPLWLIEARFYRTSINTSHFFGALVAAMIIGTGLEAHRVAEAKAEAAREARLEQVKFEEKEIVCLTNIVHHEARGEMSGVRELVGKTVLAIIGDDTSRLPKTVCGLAKVKGFFSQIKGTSEPRFADAHWTRIYGEMSGTYYGPRTLPRGWGCVRSFRVSDEQLETLSGKALAQLGFTMEAKGLKFFAAKRVPVDTRGRITFYSPRGGCKDPTPTT